MSNIQSNPNFTQQLKDLCIPFLDILKELRSQVRNWFYQLKFSEFTIKLFSGHSRSLHYDCVYEQSSQE